MNRLIAATKRCKPEKMVKLRQMVRALNAHNRYTKGSLTKDRGQAVHITMVLLSGPWNNIRSMLTHCRPDAEATQGTSRVC
jgi:hypothetical protein